MSPGRSNKLHAFNPAEPPAILFADQLAQRWNTTQATVHEWCKSGRIRAFKVGRVWRILLADIEAIETGDGGQR